MSSLARRDTTDIGPVSLFFLLVHETRKPVLSHALGSGAIYQEKVVFYLSLLVHNRCTWTAKR